MRLLLETSPVKSGDSSLKTVGQIWCRYIHVYSCRSEIIFPRHPKRMKLKFIIMCFIFDIIARIRDLLLSWLDPYGNSIISFLLVSDRLSVMTNCLGLAKLAVRPSVLFLPRTSPKSFQCDFLLGKLCKFRHRSKKIFLGGSYFLVIDIKDLGRAVISSGTTKRMYVLKP